ncbi:MAG: T9SS type A sorting domain-containing protein [Flavicella sp.]|nr:T9SS type A sorting domain-containing protein [Flavicella sp.]
MKNYLINRRKTIANYLKIMMILFVFFPMTTSVVYSQLEVYVQDYGATGDGTTNDLSAIEQAMDVFLADPEAQATLYFEPESVYRCINNTDLDKTLFNLSNQKNKKILGRGATIIGDENILGSRLSGCENIIINGLTFDYQTTSWTQGRITSVDTSEGSFIMDIDQGFPLPLPYTTPPATNPWGMLWGPTGDEIKKELIWTDQRELLGGSSVKITVRNNSKIHLEAMEINDRFTMDIVAKTTAFNHIISSAKIVYKNCNYYSARAQVFMGRLNTGSLRLDGVNIRRKPNSGRLISGYRGGFIWLNNRVGPIIENCLVEGICDDGVNMYSYYAYVDDMQGNDSFTLNRTSNMQVGDTLVFMNMKVGKELGRTRIKTIDLDNNYVTTEDGVVDVTTCANGNCSDKNDEEKTYVMNLNISNSGFRIRNNIFRNHRRYAILCRNRDGIIENNTINNTSAGVVITNEVHAFQEGPIPGNITVRDNLITNIRKWPLRITAESYANIPDKLVDDIRIENNTFRSYADEFVASIRNTKNVKLTGNFFYENSEDESKKGIQVINSENIIFNCGNQLNNSDITIVNDDFTIVNTEESEIIFDCSGSSTQGKSLSIKETVSQGLRLVRKGDLLKIFSDIEINEVHLYDLYGRKVDNAFIKNESALNVSGIVPGIYIINIYGDGLQLVKKIIL